MEAVVYEGDCLKVMDDFENDVFDAIITDPPAGISFMGKKWDHHMGGRDQWITWMATVAAECLRVTKPGGHALVWSLPRTGHWTATAWENAGWEIRDVIGHLFGSGFPKSTDVSKQLDKTAGVEREVVGKREHPTLIDKSKVNRQSATQYHATNSIKDEWNITAPATDAAKQWDGYGTALKPAHEDWILMRKPLCGTVAQNVLKHGVGGINIDGCRVEINPDVDDPRLGGKGDWSSDKMAKNVYEGGYAGVRVGSSTLGRFPANIIHDGSNDVLELFPNTKSEVPGIKHTGNSGAAYGKESRPPGTQMGGYGDVGSASRFFYCAKASKSERGVDNKHPTVKPIALMRYLCRLITPRGGLILDPFAGSGSTGVAATAEGFDSVLIELEAVSANVARSRNIQKTINGGGEKETPSSSCNCEMSAVSRIINREPDMSGVAYDTEFTG